MERFCSIEMWSGEIVALTDHAEINDILAGESVADWVWQYAPTSEVAASQHREKHDEWWDDVNSGRGEKDTY